MAKGDVLGFLYQFSVSTLLKPYNRVLIGKYYASLKIYLGIQEPIKYLQVFRMICAGADAICLILLPHENRAVRVVMQQ